MNPFRSMRRAALPLALTLAVFAGLLALPLAVSALAHTEPRGADTLWSDHQPAITAWINQLPATAAVTAANADGLTAEAAYRFSANSGATWSAWRTTNLTMTGEVSTTRRITVTNLSLANGLNFIQYRITDTLAVSATSPAFPLNVDVQAPAAPISPQPQPAGWTNINSFGVTWTNPTDINGIGGVWYKIGTAPAAANDGIFAAGNGLTQISGLAVNADGQHTLWLWLADRLGNADHTQAASAPLFLDRQPPAGLVDPAAHPAGWINANRFDLTWTAPVDASGIAGVRYRLDSPPAAPNEGDYWAGAVTGRTGYTIPGGANGEHLLWVWPVDGAGNAADPGSAMSIPLRLDTSPPGPPLTAPQVTPAGWQTSPNAAFTVTWQNPPDASGIASACYKLGSEPISDRDGICVNGADLTQITNIRPAAPGSFHLFLWLKDAAGNVDKNRRGVAIDAVRWDPSAPDLFVDGDTPTGQHGWYLVPINLSFIASDIGSGLAAIEYDLDNSGWSAGRQLRIDTEGFHSLTLRASDLAGNRTERGPDAYNYDPTPPTLAYTLNRTPGYGQWYNGAVTANFTITDATSGPAYLEWKLDDAAWRRSAAATIDADGRHTVQLRGADNAGNATAVQTLDIHIDRQPPVTSYVVLPGDPGSGWYTGPVGVTLVPADDGVGVAHTFYRINAGAWMTGTTFNLNDSGEYAIDFYSVDLLGNAETPYRIPGGVRIDTEPPRAPTPIDTQPRGWTNRNDFDLTLAMPPDLSGIAGLYYKVGAAPLSPTDGVWYQGGASVLRHVQTPGEGQFRAYVWLSDAAGNVDHTRRGVWEADLALNYDATSPTTTAQLDGVPGANTWFLSPVQVTLVATDTLSGVAQTVASVDGSPPVTTTQFTLATADKHTIAFSSTDGAGNVESTKTVTVRIDPDAPGQPQTVAINPTGWSQSNSFTLTWINPPDTSGIAAGYFKVGAPPQHPLDGVQTPPTGAATDLTVPGEGAWDLHFWLVDHAGNSGISQRVTRTAALRYDSTPPVTKSEVVAGHLAASGWYTSALTLRLTATDGASGVAKIRWAVTAEAPADLPPYNGVWQEATTDVNLTLPQTGQYLLEYQAVDLAGNLEPVRSLALKLDRDPPLPQFHSVERYQRLSSFVLSWGAVDEMGGSGLDGFDLQSRDGRNGPWSIWGNPNVPDTNGRFYGSFGHRYFFRMRARDRAGNLSAWVDLPWGVYIDRLANGDFSGRSFGAWQQGGALPRSIITTAGPADEMLLAAQLGDPTYGPNVPGFDIPRASEGTVPVGSAAITQTVRIPGLDVLDRPVLSLWYRVYTYDIAYSATQQRWYDTLDVRLAGPSGEVLALRDGLDYAAWVEGKEADLGWRYAQLPIPAAWAGEVVTFSIENWNRVDGRLNTWSLVTDIRLWEPHQLFLPRVGKPHAPAMAVCNPVDCGTARASGNSASDSLRASGLR